MPPTVPQKIYLLAIGGTGMAALAGLFRARGATVTGSDAHTYPPVSLFLAEEGIPVLEGYRPENLEWEPDLVIIGNAVPIQHVEVQEVLRRGLPYTSMAAALEDYFLPGRHPYVVAGTHGKTTTSSLLAWTLHCGGLEPGFFIGGFPLDFSKNYALGSLAPGTPFVLEGDEYNTAFFDKGPKFLHFAPRTLVLNNVEFDHADIYDSVEAIEAAFAKLVALVPAAAGAADADGGLIAANGEDERVRRLLAGAAARVVFYGDCDGSTYRARNQRVENGRGRFEVLEDGRAVAEVDCVLVGRHNAMNALGVFAAARNAGMAPEAIAAAFASFGGLKRRMEVRGELAGVVVVDDFAHHPTAVEETLRAARARWPGRRLWAAFEPKSLTGGRRMFQAQYARALAQADRVAIGPIYYRERFAADDLLDLDALVATLGNDAGGPRAAHLPSNEAVADHLAAEVAAGDVVVVMSSGSFGGLHDTLMARLRGRAGYRS